MTAAAPAPTAACLLLQASDPHFGTEQPAVVAALRRLVRAQAPALVVMSGDITQRARRAQFDAARAFADSLAPCPVLAVPGNHDLPLFNLAARLLWPRAGYRRAFGPAAPCWASPALCLLGVDTTRRWRHQDGHVSARQVADVAAALAAAGPAQLRVVVAHHPLAAMEASDAGNLLHGRAAAAAAWAAAGADLVLGGHIHLPYVLPLHQALPGLMRRLWCVQAGTAVSTRVRGAAGNSVNLVFAAPGLPPHRRACTVEQWDFDPAAQAFAPVRQHALALSPPPAWPCEPAAGGSR